MRVVGVVDLQTGRAVHARGGERDRYTPVRSLLAALAGGDAAGDALALALAYRDRLGLDDVYVADLDAIGGAAPQRDLVRRVGAACAPAALWLDAGIAAAEDALAAVEVGAASVVVGLETLPSFDALGAVVRAVGSERVVFSLDLRAGVPLVRPGASHAAESPAALAARAVEVGAGAVLVLDLTRVGGLGIDLRSIRRVRETVAGTSLYAGGGVRGPADLHRLAEAGCDGALVATALHDGRISRGDVDAVRAPRPSEGSPGMRET